MPAMKLSEEASESVHTLANRFPYPLFGVKWFGDRLIVYGGAGSRYGMKSGIAVLERIEKKQQTLSSEQSLICALNGEVYSEVAFYPSTETIWNALLLSNSVKGSALSIHCIASTPVDFQSVSFSIPDPHYSPTCEKFRSMRSLPPYALDESIESAMFDKNKNFLLCPVECTVFYRKGDCQASSRTLCKESNILFTYGIDGKSFVGVASCGNLQQQFGQHETNFVFRGKVELSELLQQAKYQYSIATESTPAMKQKAMEIRGLSGIVLHDAKRHLRFVLLAEDGIRSLCLLCTVQPQNTIKLIQLCTGVAEKGSRVTGCFWMTHGSFPLFCVIRAGAVMTSMSLYAMRTDNFLELHQQIKLTETSATACCTIAEKHDFLVVIGTAEGIVMVFSMNAKRIIRRGKIMDTPITAVEVRSKLPPVLCATGLSGEIYAGNVYQLPFVLPKASVALFLVLYGLGIGLCVAWQLFLM